MGKTSEQVVQEQVDAYNARDVKAFLKTYHPEAGLFNHPEGETVAVGREAMDRIYAKMFGELTELHVDITDRIVHGKFVIDREAVRGLPGKEVQHAVAIYEVEGDTIQNVWFLRE
ncbi:MAG: nuclear transport factor 2 family protein [Planctomycetota bacterium]|jgi:hypothetical protein